jgi:hypothetical protein
LVLGDHYVHVLPTVGADVRARLYRVVAVGACPRHVSIIKAAIRLR